MARFFFIIITILLNVNLAYAQRDNFLEEQGKKLCSLDSDITLCKAHEFYQKKVYDSCYTYSSKALLSEQKHDAKCYLIYIQGYSAYKKRLYKKSLVNMLELIKNEDYKQSSLYLLGSIYLNLKDFRKAIIYIEKWIKDDTNKVPRIQKLMYHDLGISYLHLKEYTKAKKYFDMEIDLLNSKDTLSIIKTKMDLANVYYNQYVDNEAIPLFKEAFDLAKLYSNLEWKKLTTQNMAVVERNRKNYKESVKYYEEYIKWKDSIWNRDNIVGLVEKDKQIAVAQKQQEITLHEEELKRQKLVQNGLLAGASGLVVFIGFLGFLYRKLKIQNELITQQKEDLNVANKTKNYLFSVVSHDLRSPMNTIKSQHIDLKNHIEANNLEGIKKANNAAILVTESTSHLLNNVLHWSLEQSNQLVFNTKEYALRPLVQHVLHDYTHLVDARGITIETELENILVNIDKESIKIVLRNLLDNALKYMGNKGRITIKTGNFNDNEAFITVEDTGQGISAEKLKKINALKDLTIDKIDRSKGVGLGLLLCQTLVKKNKGSISFESEEGKGTRITIVLPKVIE
ncbi:tetratricopeptide repeat-containing sensor histidine kinase [Tenacibaculum xiamenense]|uniref:tetratricopeptide repeat-containing sensor histidine kinase n=1 Tax=Tenacibaculum xiamenense TaxID=1261553 RepID=UPI0038942CEA